MKKLFLLIALILALSVQAQAQTTTPNLGLVLPLAPADSWGEDINDNFTTLDALFPGGQSGHTIQNEGTALAPRANLNMVGAGVDCANSSTTTTTCTITGGGGVGDPGTITITGDVTGSGTGSFSTTIAADAVALGTDTTGNYVSSATGNQGLLFTGTEGGSLGLIDCAAGEILKRNTTQTTWECAADATGDTAAAVAHIADTTDAHAGTAITNTPAGNIAATTAQAAINELDTEKMEATSAAVVTTFDGGACSGYLKSDGSCDDAVTAHSALTGRDTAADSHPALYPLVTDGNGDPSAASGASALGHIYIRNDCTVNGATVPCPFLANDVGGDFYSFGIYANSYSERTSPDGTSRNAVNNQTELTLASSGVASTEYAKRSGGSATTNFANQPNNDGQECLSSSAADTTQSLTLVGTTTGTGLAVFETITLNGTTPVSTVKVDWGNVHLGVLSVTAAGTITCREASGNLAIFTISAGDLHAASAHLTWIRADGTTQITGAIHLDFDDDDHLQYALATSSAGAPAADACVNERHIIIDTTNDEIYHCPNGAASQPLTAHSKSAAYNLIQGNSGSAAPAAGGSTLNIVGAGTVNCVAADGSPDTVTCTGTGTAVKNLCRWDAKQGHAPATLFAQLDTMAGTSTPAEVIPILKFDPDTIWYMDFRCQIPAHYAGGGYTLSIYHSNTTNTLETVFSGAFRRVVLDSSDLNTTAHTYDYNNSTAITVASAIGEVVKTAITFTNGADADSATASDYIILRVRRFATDAGDDNLGVSEVHLVVLDET